jgi:hypothetical protein
MILIVSVFEREVHQVEFWVGDLSIYLLVLCIENVLFQHLFICNISSDKSAVLWPKEQRQVDSWLFLWLSFYHLSEFDCDTPCNGFLLVTWALSSMSLFVYSLWLLLIWKFSDHCSLTISLHLPPGTPFGVVTQLTHVLLSI